MVRQYRTIVKLQTIHVITSFTYDPTYFCLPTTFKNERHFMEAIQGHYMLKYVNDS